MKENKNWKKQIALFLISQNLSMFGSSVVGFSIVWYITVTTESGFWITLSTLATLITPAVFLSPLMVVRSFGSEVWKLTAKEILESLSDLVRIESIRIGCGLLLICWSLYLKKVAGLALRSI